MEFSLRPWKSEDIPSLIRHANNIEVARFLKDRFPHPYTAEHAEVFMKMAADVANQLILAIVVNGEPCGSLGIHPMGDIFRKNAEIGYWLTPEHWGKGIISRSIPVMINKGFEMYDITRIFARVFGNNPASRRVLEKNGFVMEAELKGTLFKNNEFLDEWILGIRKDTVRI